MSYDQSNLFARILRKEIPSCIIFENDYALAFHDIHPRAPIHVLIIPKGPYENAGDFYQNAPEDDNIGYNRAIGAVIDLLNVGEGYRLITNCGANGGQEIPHFHTHLLGGKSLGSMVL